MTIKKRGSGSLWGIVPVVVVCLSMIGCASGEKPKANIANADMAIQRAREANAINYAPLELKVAEDKLQQAKKASDEEKYTNARWLADEARADAELAEAKSQSARTGQIEQQVRQDVETLRRETIRTAPEAQSGR